MKVFQVTIRREWLPLVAAETQEEALEFARLNKCHMVGGEVKIEEIEGYELSRKMLKHIPGSLVWHPGEDDLSVGDILDPPVYHSYGGDGWHFDEEE